MIIIFDLDDTLYEEITFVKGGFKAVAFFLEKYIYINSEIIYKDLMNILEEKGRGKIFDLLLLRYNKYKKNLVKKCISVYRSHKPNINIDRYAKDFLISNKNSTFYLVTDGNKNVQARKIEALKIRPYFKGIFITHRYGIKNAKPSLYCFQKIKEIEKEEWDNMIYIGDNPNKDFVSLNKVYAKTIRVLTGNYSHEIVSEKYDALVTISTLKDLPLALGRI